MDVVGEATRFVTGRTEAHGGAGDSSVLTAYGVFQGMRAAAEHVWGEPTLAGRTVGVAGVGKVGRHLAGHLIEDGAERRRHRRQRSRRSTALRAELPAGRASSPTPTALVASELDVYAPCALGGALDDEAVEALRAADRLRRANNQLAEGARGIENALAERGILYAPDYWSTPAA